MSDRISVDTRPGSGLQSARPAPRAVLSSGTDPLPASRSPRFLGRAVELLRILLANLGLTLVTLGVYHFWGKARLRRYVWGHVAIEGEAFAFHGTGREMFIGWLKVFAIFSGNALILNVAARSLGPTSPVVLLLNVLFLASLTVLTPFIIVAVRRYRLSRTTWKGIRFAFAGAGVELLGTYLLGLVLTAVTLGFYSPIFTSDVYGYVTDHTRYGDRPFRYDGRGKDLLWPWARAFLLGFVTFGLSWFWYAAARDRYLRSHTTCGGIRFESTVTGGKLLWLALSNALLILVTLGIGTPWAMANLLSFECRNLVLRGVLDTSGVKQSSDLGPAIGEGLASHFDLDAGFGG